MMKDSQNGDKPNMLVHAHVVTDLKLVGYFKTCSSARCRTQVGVLLDNKQS